MEGRNELMMDGRRKEGVDGRKLMEKRKELMTDLY